MYTWFSYNILFHLSTFYDTQTIRHIPTLYYTIRVDTFLTYFDIMSIFVEYVFRGTWSSNIHVSTLFDTIWHHLTQFDKLFCLFLLVFVECFWYRTGEGRMSNAVATCRNPGYVSYFDLIRQNSPAQLPKKTYEEKIISHASFPFSFHSGFPIKKDRDYSLPSLSFL